MHKEDDDFKLSHFQLIKVCKLLLHKINIQNTKNKNEREKITAAFTGKYDETEGKMRMQINEMHTFLHVMHQVSDKHEKKLMELQSGINSKANRLTEAANKTLDALA